MINGNEYSWEDIQVLFPGKNSPVDGVAAIEYEVKKDHSNIYGRGSKPVAMGRGKEEYAGSITLLQSEVEALQKTLEKGKNLTNIPAFNIVVSYVPPDGVIVTDQLVQCRFAEIKKGMKSGDPNMEIQLKLVIGDIIFNA